MKVARFTSFDDKKFWLKECWYNPATKELLPLTNEMNTHQKVGLAYLRSKKMLGEGGPVKSIYDDMFELKFTRIAASPREFNIEGYLIPVRLSIQQIFKNGVVDEWALKSKSWSPYRVVISLLKDTHPLIRAVGGTIFDMSSDRDVSRLEVFATF